MVTTEEYHNKFLEYLRHTPFYRRASVSKLENLAHYLEVDVLLFLQQNTHTAYTFVYNYNNKVELKRLSNDLLTNNSLSKTIDVSALRDGLKFLIGFIESKFEIPIPIKATFLFKHFLKKTFNL